ncbi:hypothetical protein GCM10027591_11920 [Zhihengliuella somnathii]
MLEGMGYRDLGTHESRVRAVGLGAAAVLGLAATALAGPSLAAGEQEQAPAEITREQGETDLAWQRKFSHLTTQLAQEFPRAFAGSHIDSEAPEAATIGFVGTPPAEAVKRIEAFEGATITVLSDRPWSMEQLDRRLATAHQAAFARQDLVDAAVGHASYVDGSITLDVQPVDAAASRTGSAGVAEQIKDEISDPGLRASVEVKVVESAEFTPESVRSSPDRSD